MNDVVVKSSKVTWDQAQFSFRFVITLRRARRNENRAWYKPSTKRLPPTFRIDWHLPNQPTKITSVACFSSMQIFYAWEKCRQVFCKNTWKPLIQWPNRVVMWSKSKKTQTHSPYPQVLLLFKAVETLAWNIFTDNILPTWCQDFIKRFAFIILQNITYAFLTCIASYL